MYHVFLLWLTTLYDMKPDLSNTVFPDVMASADDLRINRLQNTTTITVDQIWGVLNNERDFAMVKQKGAEEQILKMFKYVVQIFLFSRQF